MDNSVKITLIVVLGFLAVMLIGVIMYSSTLNRFDQKTVQGNGIAEIEVTPDLVSIYFNAESRADTSKEASEMNTEITDNLITEIIKLGFERKDIVTENFNVYPEYDWTQDDGRTLKGYVATHTIKVKMDTDDYRMIGDVVDAGVSAGALVNYINFELSQSLQNTFKATALELATKDAKIKAQAIANGLDASLGDVVTVSSSDFDYYPWPVFRSAAVEDSAYGAGTADAAMVKEATTSIVPGEQTVSARVTVVYELK